MSAIDQIYPDRLAPIFEFHQTDGQTFKIYTDGSTEGFGKGFVINRIPLHLARIPHHGEIGGKEG